MNFLNIEIKAIDKDGAIGKKKLREQYCHFMALPGVMQEHLIADSYSEMAMNIGN